MNYTDPAHQITRELRGRQIEYLAVGRSTVTPNSNTPRRFKIVDVEDVAFSITTGKRFVSALVHDLDDGRNLKHRTLHLSGITIL